MDCRGSRSYGRAAPSRYCTRSLRHILDSELNHRRSFVDAQAIEEYYDDDNSCHFCRQCSNSVSTFHHEVPPRRADSYCGKQRAAIDCMPYSISSPARFTPRRIKRKFPYLNSNSSLFTSSLRLCKSLYRDNLPAYYAQTKYDRNTRAQSHRRLPSSTDACPYPVTAVQLSQVLPSGLAQAWCDEMMECGASEEEELMKCARRMEPFVNTEVQAVPEKVSKEMHTLSIPEPMKRTIGTQLSSISSKPQQQSIEIESYPLKTFENKESQSLFDIMMTKPVILSPDKEIDEVKVIETDFNDISETESQDNVPTEDTEYTIMKRKLKTKLQYEIVDLISNIVLQPKRDLKNISLRNTILNKLNQKLKMLLMMSKDTDFELIRAIRRHLAVAMDTFDNRRANKKTCSSKSKVSNTVLCKYTKGPIKSYSSVRCITSDKMQGFKRNLEQIISKWFKTLHVPDDKVKSDWESKRLNLLISRVKAVADGKMKVETEYKNILKLEIEHFLSDIPLVTYSTGSGRVYMHKAANKLLGKILKAETTEKSINKDLLLNLRKELLNVDDSYRNICAANCTIHTKKDEIKETFKHEISSFLSGHNVKCDKKVLKKMERDLMDVIMNSGKKICIDTNDIRSVLQDMKIFSKGEIHDLSNKIEKHLKHQTINDTGVSKTKNIRADKQPAKTPELTTSKNTEIDTIKNFDTKTKMVAQQIQDWLIEENYCLALKPDFCKATEDLAADIVDRQIYLGLKNRNETTQEEEIKFLKYQIFKSLNCVLGDKNEEIISHAPELMKRLKQDTVESLSDTAKYCDCCINSPSHFEKLLNKTIHACLNKQGYTLHPVEVQILSEILTKSLSNKEKETDASQMIDDEIDSWSKYILQNKGNSALLNNLKEAVKQVLCQNKKDDDGGNCVLIDDQKSKQTCNPNCYKICPSFMKKRRLKKSETCMIDTMCKQSQTNSVSCGCSPTAGCMSIDVSRVSSRNKTAIPVATSAAITAFTQFAPESSVGTCTDFPEYCPVKTIATSPTQTRPQGKAGNVALKTKFGSSPGKSGKGPILNRSTKASSNIFSVQSNTEINARRDSSLSRAKTPQQIDNELDAFLKEWCDKLPIDIEMYKDQATADTARLGLRNGIAKQIVKIRADQLTKQDKNFYEHMLAQEVDDMLDCLPQSVELQNMRQSAKSELLDYVVDYNNRLLDAYKMQTTQQQINQMAALTGGNFMELLIQDNFLDDYIKDNCIVTDQNIILLYKHRLALELRRILCEHKEKGPNRNDEELKEEIYRGLNSVSIPTDYCYHKFAQEALIKMRIEECRKDIPFKVKLTAKEEIQLDHEEQQLSETLTEIMLNDSSNSEWRIEKEVCKFISKLPHTAGKQLENEFIFNKLMNRLKNNTNFKKVKPTSKSNLTVGIYNKLSDRNISFSMQTQNKRTVSTQYSVTQIQHNILNSRETTAVKEKLANDILKAEETKYPFFTIPASDTQNLPVQQETELSPVTGKVRYTSSDILLQYVVTWGDLASSPQQATMLSAMITTKISKIHQNPAMLTDDFLYDRAVENILEEALDLFGKKMDPVEKSGSIAKILEQLKVVREMVIIEQTIYGFRQEVLEKVNKITCKATEVSATVDNIADALIILHYEGKDKKEQCEKKLIERINEHVLALKVGIIVPGFDKQVKEDIFKTLMKIPPLPKEVLDLEIDEIKLKQLIDECVQKLPAVAPSTIADTQRQAAVKTMLAKKVMEIKTKMPTTPSDLHNRIKTATLHCMKYLPLQDKQEARALEFAESIAKMLIENGSCMSYCSERDAAWLLFIPGPNRLNMKRDDDKECPDAKSDRQRRKSPVGYESPPYSVRKRSPTKMI